MLFFLLCFTNISDNIYVMSDITDRIESLLNLTHQKRADIVRSTGINESTIRGWITGRMPSADALYQVAQFFGVTVEWLLTGNGIDLLNKKIDKLIQSELEIESMQPMNYQEQKLIDSFRHLQPRDKNIILSLSQCIEKMDFKY